MGEEWPRCAEREVMEETGLEVSNVTAGLPPLSVRCYARRTSCLAVFFFRFESCSPIILLR